MNFNPVRSVLKHNRDWICFSCLFQCAPTPRWQRPFRRALSSKVILPAISSAAAAALHEDLDKTDGIISKSDRRRSAKKARSKARLLSVKEATTTAVVAKVGGQTKELGSVPHRNDLPASGSENVLSRKRKSDSKTKRASGRSETPGTAGPSQSSKHSPSTKPKSVKGVGKAGKKKITASSYVETSNTARSSQSSNDSPPIKPRAANVKGKSKSKKDVQVETTAVSEELGVKLWNDENSTTADLGEESATTNVEEPQNVSHAKSFRKTTSKDAGPSADPRKMKPNAAFRRVVIDATIAAPASRSRRLIRTQRRREALEQRRKLFQKTTRLIRKIIPQSQSTQEPAEPFSMPTKTIREALLTPLSFNTVATKSKLSGLSRNLNANEKWLDETTKKSLAQAVYKKNREKTEAVENETKPKTLKSDIKHINAHDYTISALDIEQPAVPRLSYGLDRVLFNPGVYHLQDPRSRVYNFDPYLQSIMPVSEFDFTALKEYITSSRDTSLKEIAEEHGKRYIGSTSSMTGVLAHFHFLLSQWREINTSMMSRGFPDKLTSFTLIQRCPSAIFLRWKDGTYAIDADKEFATSNILSMLGKAMEKLLTLNTEGFERYRKSNPDQLSQKERIEPEAFHYSTMGDFLMRSQLDAHDPRLPGTGMFDLKTRAVVAIRMDTQNPEQGSSYEIKERFGEFESFEREYFDMIRSAFLKYSLQVRMGRMDGIFVAFHNTERIFGFQYISLEEMDLTLHGQSDTALGDQEFKLSLELLNQVLDKATAKFPEQSVRIHFETRDATTPFMYVFAEPVTEDEVNELQSRNQAKIEEFERELLGLHKDEDNAEEDNQWDDIQAKVEEAMEKDERGEESFRIIVPAEETPLGHATEEYENASTLNETFDPGTPDVNQESLAASVTTESGRDGEEDDVDGEDSSVSNNNQTLNKERNPEKYFEGDEDEHDHASKIKHEGGTEEIIALETEAENQNASAGRDDTKELPTQSKDSSATDEKPDSLEQATTNQLAADAPSPDPPIANPDKTSAPHHRPLDFDSAADTTFLNTLTAERSSSIPPNHPPVLAMTLTIRNKIDGKYVLRPENLTATTPPDPPSPASAPNDDHASSPPTATSGWSIEYTLTDVSDPDRAWALYQACRARRRKKLEPEESDEEDKRTEWYVRRMRELNLKGRRWREERGREESGRGRVVLGREADG